MYGEENKEMSDPEQVHHSLSFQDSRVALLLEQQQKKRMNMAEFKKTNSKQFVTDESILEEQKKFRKQLDKERKAKLNKSKKKIKKIKKKKKKTKSGEKHKKKKGKKENC